MDKPLKDSDCVVPDFKRYGVSDEMAKQLEDYHRQYFIRFKKRCDEVKAGLTRLIEAKRRAKAAEKILNKPRRK